MKTINLYMCGPTLFDFVHIGCYRIFILADIIDKHFTSKGYEVNHGINIMDIDDKIISNYKKNKDFTTDIYYDSLRTEFDALNIRYPNKETRTTSSVKDIQKLIKHYLKQDIAYETDSGIYLDLLKISNYGELSNIDIANNKAHITILDKRNISDPSLWRFNDDINSYVFMKKKGRPGWDVQCANCCISKMSSKIDYQFAGFNDVTHYENNKVLIENSYNYDGYQSKWILPKYINFVDNTPCYYMKDFLELYSRQVLKYAMYSMSYSTQFDLSLEYFDNCQKNVNKLNVFYNKISNICEFSDSDDNDVNFVLEKLHNIDFLIENLKITVIFGLIFKLIRIINRNNFYISKKQINEILNLFKYLNERMDFII